MTKKLKKGAKKVKVEAAVNSEDDVEDGEDPVQAPKKRTKKATAKAVGPPEEASGCLPNCDNETTKPIKTEPYNEPVDMSLFAAAAQLLQDYESGHA